LTQDANAGGLEPSLLDRLAHSGRTRIKIGGVDRTARECRLSGMGAHACCTSDQEQIRIRTLAEEHENC
jgi:hypothetical protein